MQYISKSKFGSKKVKLELPEKFDRKPSNLNNWIIEVEKYCQIIGISNIFDIVKFFVSCS